jgi:hypothetical protein
LERIDRGRMGFFIILINKEKSRDIILKPGKLLLWACIYIHLFWITCFTYKELEWFKWYVPLKPYFWKDFTKIWGTLYGGVSSCNVFKMGTYLFLLKNLLWKSFGEITIHPSFGLKVFCYEKLEMIVKTFSKVYEKLFCHPM